MNTVATNETAYILNVNYGDKIIGTLSSDKSTNLLKLKYNEYWQRNGFAISPSLPLSNQHSAEAAYNYLDNALPEGTARNLLAERIGVSEKNVYLQVRALGKDLAGAITFNKIDNQGSQKDDLPAFRILEEDELATRLDHKEELGLLTWDDKPRLSVAGVQDKLNVFIDDHNRIGFGDGSLCSTYILKFEKKNCPNLVLNEYLCMKLSKAVGLPTAEVEFTRIGQHPVLIVKRFDRMYIRGSERVMRRHVIDGCQALNLPREYKYEKNLGDGRDVKHIRDGASLESLFAFCKTVSSPAESTQWVLNWQLFNLMINNYDSHGKNVSIFFDKKTSKFTPAYDLVNIAMFTQFKHVLAMAMGDEFEPSDIHAYQFADFAETCSIDKKLLTRTLTSLSDRVIRSLTNDKLLSRITNDGNFSDEDVKYLNLVSDSIIARTLYLRSQAAEISMISV
ncbi:MAG: HipA domain protein [Gammaproteobacteria bacterium]|nr:MAG: HipA domain protein [Gammaproteobacteria bacterium]